MELVLRNKSEEVTGVVHPVTAEVLEFGVATREQLGSWYLAMLEWQAQAAAAVRMASKAFAEQSDREASLSVHVDGRVVSVPGGGLVFELDYEELRKLMLELVASGDITQQAADETCRPLGVHCWACGEFNATEGYRINKAKLANMRKVPSLNALIEACGKYVPKTRPLKAK